MRRAFLIPVAFVLVGIVYLPTKKNDAGMFLASVAYAAKGSIATLPENGALDLGPYRWTDTGGHANGELVTDYSGMVYAPVLQAMVIFGGGHAATDYDGINTFSSKTLTWKELYLPTRGDFMTPQNYDAVRGAWMKAQQAPHPRPVARHTIDELVVVGDELIILAQVEGNARTAGTNWPGGYTSYNLVTPGRVVHVNLRTLESAFAAHDYGADNYSAAEYDPPSGKVLLLGYRGLYIYDPVTKTKTRAIDFLSRPGNEQLHDEKGNKLPAGALSYNQNLIYYPPNGRHYYIVSRATAGRSAGSVFELELDRHNFAKSIVRRVADAPMAGIATKFAYDSKNRLIGGGLWQGVFYAFDPKAKVWTDKNMKGPRSIAFMAMDYDPEANAYIFLTPERRTWAYRWK